jgi:hypothetical protein
MAVRVAQTFKPVILVLGRQRSVREFRSQPGQKFVAIHVNQCLGAVVCFCHLSCAEQNYSDPGETQSQK